MLDPEKKLIRRLSLRNGNSNSVVKSTQV
ncbi:uncharacterized protein METZ01_LOCUS344420, partial [marine metagenome]